MFVGNTKEVCQYSEQRTSPKGDRSLMQPRNMVSFFFLSMYPCVYGRIHNVHMCRCMCVQVPVEAGGGCQESSSVPLPPHSLKQDLPIKPRGSH